MQIKKAKNSQPQSITIAKRGIRTVNDFSSMMSALMGDLLSGTVTPAVGNSVCKAGSNMLKAVEMQYKYGTPTQPQGDSKVLVLAN